MPVNINLLSDEAIARGITPPDIGNFGTSLAATQNYLQQQAEQNLFAKGLPRVPGTNDIDWAAAGEQIARLQGVKGLQTAVGLQTEADLQRALGRLGTSSIFQSGQTSERPPLPPTSQGSGIRQTAPSATGPAADSGGGAPLRPGDQGNLTGPDRRVTRVDIEGQGTAGTSPELTARILAPRIGKDPDQLAAEWGVGVDQPLDPAEVRSKVAASPSFADRFSGGGTASAATAGVTPTPIATVPIRAGVPHITIPGPQTAPAEQSNVQPTPPLTPPLRTPSPLTDPVADDYEKRATEAAAAATAISMKNPAMGARLQAISDQLFKAAHDRRQTLGKVYTQGQETELKQQMVLPEAAAKDSVTRLADSQKRAETTAEGITVTQDLFNQLNSKSGIFTGAWADDKLKWSRIAETLGYPINTDKITNTQTFMSAIGKQVASGVKAFGSGTSITNQDREYVQKMVGGDISLDETSIRRVLQLADKLNRGVIQKHNEQVDSMIKAQPNARAYLEPYRVTIPPPIQGRTTQPTPGPAGTMQPPSPDPGGRTVGQVYQTGKGPAYWRGNGWELVR